MIFNGNTYVIFSLAELVNVWIILSFVIPDYYLCVFVVVTFVGPRELYLLGMFMRFSIGLYSDTFCTYYFAISSAGLVQCP